MKEYIRVLSTLLIPYGGVHQWPMEAPHKGPTMRKASIMHLQVWTCLLVCLQHYGKTNYTLRWPHVSIRGFRLTGNSNCLFNIAYRQNETRKLKFRLTDRLRGEPTDDQWSRHTKGQPCDKHGSTLLIPCEEKPPVTYGIFTQGPSMRKTTHLAVPTF